MAFLSEVPHVFPRFRWSSVPADEAVVADLAERFDLPRAAAQILAGRGHGDPACASRFLAPRLQQLGDPLAFPGMAAAAARIWTAIHNREPVVVYGDFDADGVTAAALLTDVIRGLGGCATPFLPDRVTEGYGLTRAALARCLREHPARLLVTVDCGINSVDEAAQAAAAGVDVIITDHHEPSARQPAALALVNPRLGATPGAEGLCGAGVAFKLAHALLKLGRGSGHAGAGAYEIRAWLDAVAVATVADVVPLTGENRILVNAGLSSLAQRPRPGLRALQRRAGVQGAVTSHQLAFVLGPRLNAAGRMRTGWPALNLLLARETDAADALAIELEHLNAERRTKEAAVLEAATARLRETSPEGAVVVAGEGWHVGTIGIVAARLSETWGLPAAVIALDASGGGRGSVRGGRGDNVVAALAACGALLQGFGGHPRAAGLQLKAGALDAFRTQFGAACATQRPAGDTRAELAVDGWLTAGELSPQLWAALQRLEPFGEGHTRPRWGMRGVRFAARPEPVGAGGDHLRIRLQADGISIQGVWFRMGRHLEAISRLGAGPVDVLFELHENTYAGNSSLEMQLMDLRPAAE
jgi:single-stranded-DNA-specific exonuclease